MNASRRTWLAWAALLLVPSCHRNDAPNPLPQHHANAAIPQPGFAYGQDVPPALPTPVRVAEPVRRAPWAVANEDPQDDYVVGPPVEIADCLAQLGALGVKAKPAQQPVHQEGSRTCGSPQVVSYEGGPTGVRWNSPPKVTCLVALALVRFEAIVEEEALRNFGTKVKRLDHMGTYSCRPMVRFNMASEHSFANAIDVGSVELTDGRKFSVDADWGAMAQPPSTPGATFFRTVARRTYDDGAFSVVLGPPWDALHKNHLHLDQARYRVDGLIVRR